MSVSNDKNKIFNYQTQSRSCTCQDRVYSWSACSTKSISVISRILPNLHVCTAKTLGCWDHIFACHLPILMDCTLTWTWDRLLLVSWSSDLERVTSLGWNARASTYTKFRVEGALLTIANRRWDLVGSGTRNLTMVKNTSFIYLRLISVSFGLMDTLFRSRELGKLYWSGPGKLLLYWSSSNGPPIS